MSESSRESVVEDEEMSYMDDTQTADVLYIENDQLKRDVKLLEDRLHEYECSVNTAPMFFAMKMEERLQRVEEKIDHILNKIPWERVQ